MDAEQQAALQAVQAELSGNQPLAAQEEGASHAQAPENNEQTNQEASATESASPEPTQTDKSASEGTPDGQKAASEEPKTGSEEVKSAAEAYQEKLQTLMAKQREQYESNVRQKQEREYMERLRRIEEAKQYGPDAVLRAAGLDPSETPQKKGPSSLDELLGLEPQDDEPAYVKELKQRVEQQEQFIRQFQEQFQTTQQQQQAQQQQQWEQQELQRISQFIDQSKDKYQYLAALKPMKSDQDLYSGMLNMYNQGYQPSVEDMAELVESRVEALVDHLAEVPKFREWISKRLGVQVSPQNKQSASLSNKMGGETPGEVDISTLPEDEQMRLALEAAYAAAGEVKKA